MLYIAADHGGFELKESLVKFLEKQLKMPVTDLGAKTFNKEDDFPDYAIPLARKVAEDKVNLGILICGSGHGVCIAASKIKGVRASIGYSVEGAELAKKDDDVNVLCLAGRLISDEYASAIVKKFLETKFDSQEKRVRRLKKVEELEK